jgi:hypothetical protein
MLLQLGGKLDDGLDDELETPRYGSVFGLSGSSGF